jgi:hypothetical protein
VAGQLADSGLNALGARRCAAKGHRWRDARTYVLTEDGDAYEAPRGTMQRCTRCGVTRPRPA